MCFEFNKDKIVVFLPIPIPDSAFYKKPKLF